MKDLNKELPPEDKKSEQTSYWRGLLLWVLLALLLRWQVIEPRWIPSGSMLPTLQIQDRVLIEKISPRINKIQKKHFPKEKIVVFHPPQVLIEQGYEAKTALIKRVVGVPGDKLEVHNGSLIRNGKPINEDWIESPIAYEMNEIIVPKSSLWVLGDNRNNSLDSHIWGPLPEENIIGTAIWRYWPLKNLGPIRFPTHQKFGMTTTLR